MATNRRLWSAMVAVAVFAGCNSSGGGNSAVAPTADEVTQAQVANAGSSVREQTQSAANNSILESGAPGSTASSSGEAPASVSSAGSTINFQGSVNLTVNLDALNSSGQRIFPNASGQFSVAATGTVTGNSSSGQVTYAVQVTWITDGVFTDPDCGASVTVAAGSTWSYDLTIVWSKTDDLNWSIQATSDVSGSVNATVTHQSNTWTVSGSVDRHDSVTFSSTAGTLAFSLDVHGQRTLVVSNGTVTHTVVITMAALNSITIEVDGVTFGPYTLAQIRSLFEFDCNG